MAKEIATVIAPGLHLREIPGSDPKQIIDSLNNGDKLEVIERRPGKQAEWLRVRVYRTQAVGWVAERNYSTGHRFVSISSVAEPRPQTDPVPNSSLGPCSGSSNSATFPMRFVLLGFAIVVGFGILIARLF